MPDKDKLVIWPIYFDASRTRREGRMVSLQDAIKEPTLDMTVAAAIKSGFKPEIEKEKKHPRIWHEAGASGRILVPKKGPKSAILKHIAKSLKGKRGREGDTGRGGSER